MGSADSTSARSEPPARITTTARSGEAMPCWCFGFESSVRRGRHQAPPRRSAHRRRRDRRRGRPRGRRHGDTYYESTCCRWRREYARMGKPEAERLRELDEENVRLEELLAERALGNDILRGVARGTFWARRGGARRSPTSGASSAFASAAPAASSGNRAPPTATVPSVRPGTARSWPARTGSPATTRATAIAGRGRRGGANPGLAVTARVFSVGPDGRRGRGGSGRASRRAGGRPR